MPTSNPRRARQGAQRSDDGLGGEQVEGRHAVRELLVAGKRRTFEVLVADDHHQGSVLDEITDLARDQGASVSRVSRESLGARARTDAPQGVIARAEPLQALGLSDLLQSCQSPAFLLVVDGVTDPHNLGAILRSGLGAGVQGVVLRAPRAVAITPVVAKAAAGAIEHLSFALVPGIANALSDLSRAGVWSVGLDAHEGRDLEGVEVLDRDVALVLGDEGEGLAKLVRERCDVLASIKLPGPIESLNVSAASAIATYVVARARRLSEKDEV